MLKTFQNLLDQQIHPVLSLGLVTSMRVSWYVRNQVDESEWLYSIPQQFFGFHLLWINVDYGLQFSCCPWNIRNLGIIRILRRFNFKGTASDMFRGGGRELQRQRSWEGKEEVSKVFLFLCLNTCLPQLILNFYSAKRQFLTPHNTRQSRHCIQFCIFQSSSCPIPFLKT